MRVKQLLDQTADVARALAPPEQLKWVEQRHHRPALEARWADHPGLAEHFVAAADLLAGLELADGGAEKLLIRAEQLADVGGEQPSGGRGGDKRAPRLLQLIEHLVDRGLGLRAASALK